MDLSISSSQTALVCHWMYDPSLSSFWLAEVTIAAAFVLVWRSHQNRRLLWWWNNLCSKMYVKWNNSFEEAPQDINNIQNPQGRWFLKLKTIHIE